MNISKAKIISFFIAVILMVWFLYPRELFMAFINEGKADLLQAENYYRAYLEKHPYNKFATLRLSGLYERMAEPEKAIELLQDLLKHRENDWEVNRTYLDLINYAGRERDWVREQLRVAEHFSRVPRFSRGRLRDLYGEIFDYALWHQDFAMAEKILKSLSSLNENEKDLDELMDTHLYLARVQKKMDRLTELLIQKLGKNPKDLESRRDLSELFLFRGFETRAMTLIEEGLTLSPDDIGFWDLKLAALLKLGRLEDAEATLKVILGFGDLKEDRYLDYLAKLADVYQKQKKWGETIGVYELILSMGVETGRYLREFAGLLTEIREFKRAAKLWRDYLDRFPDDEDAEKSLAELYLYELKDREQTLFYRDYLAKVRDDRFAEDLLYFYLEGNPLATQKEAWFVFLKNLFPHNTVILDHYVFFLMDEKRHDEALVLSLKLMKRQPENAEWILRLAFLYQQTGEPRLAVIQYQKLARLRFADFNTLLIVGRELYYLGHVEKALDYFAHTKKLEPASPHPLFWQQECYHYLLKPKNMRATARQAIQLFSARTNLTREEKRMFLKSRARLSFNKNVRRDYRELIRHFPDDTELRADFIDILLAQKKSRLAEREIKHFRKRFSLEAHMMWPFEVRLAFLRRDWKRADELIEKILLREPKQVAYRQDLADARLRQGLWRGAIQQYREVLATDPKNKEVEARIAEIREGHDHQIWVEFEWADFGSDLFWKTATGYRGYWGDRLKTRALFQYGDFDSQSLGQSDEARFAEFRMDYHFLSDLSFGVGLSGAHGGSRATVTPAVYFDWGVFENLKLSGRGAWHELRADFSQALVQGVLMDHAGVSWLGHTFGRIVWQGEYEWTRNLLPNGASSIGHRFEPSVSYILLRKQPYFTLGYQFSFLNHSDQGGFLNQVALVPERQSHFLVGHLSHEFWPHLRVESGFFAGEDPVRNLHLFQGDLFGLNAGILWRALPVLDVKLDYEFGRETFAGTGGKAHFLSLMLSGHWL